MSLFKTITGGLGPLIRRLHQDDRGSSVTEMAVAAPIFLLMFAGTVETGNLLLLNMKAQHAAVAVADLITRDDELSQDTLDDIFIAVPAIMDPLPIGDASRMIVSSVNQPAGGSPEIVWQRGGAGTLEAASELGGQGSAVNLPNGLTLLDNETIVVAEFYYEYRPLIFDVLSVQVIRKEAFFRPRIGSLLEIE